MKKMIVLAAVFAAVFSLHAADTVLPAPVKTGGISLNEALNAR